MARPGIPAVVLLLAAGALLLVVGTLVDLATIEPAFGSRLVAIGPWRIDIGSGAPAQQYNGALPIVVGFALVLVAAASLNAGFRWTRSASLAIGGIGAGTGVSVAMAGISASSFLNQVVSSLFGSPTGSAGSPPVGLGIWFALLAGFGALVAVLLPPRWDAVESATEGGVETA
ncbi:hypothetical protein BCF44_102413 [Kutzneria buriramensis]|uniref:Uncharacterized protein n=1 Tax=Kutzneria buriramensis TaxID=1045776 RepID=A0A3E0I6E2_9PSEU|nr:hypothetical protein BCF44_102413 [Kutzneria buriramensis]